MRYMIILRYTKQNSTKQANSKLRVAFHNASQYYAASDFLVQGPFNATINQGVITLLLSYKQASTPPLIRW